MGINFTADDLEGGSYLGEGEHEVTVTQVEAKNSKAGNPMTVVTMATASGKSALEFFSHVDKARFKIAGFARACGFSKEYLLAGKFTMEQLKGKRLRMIKTKTGVEMHEGKERGVYEQEYATSQVNTGAQPQELASQVGKDDLPF